MPTRVKIHKRCETLLCLKKIGLIFPVLMFSFVCMPVRADIGANATTATCEYSVLNAYSGTVNMEEVWVPNNIELSWYDGETQMSGTTQSCDYGETFNVPSAPTPPTGYVFTGWKIRELNCSLISGLECSSTSGCIRTNSQCRNLVSDCSAITNQQKCEISAGPNSRGNMMCTCAWNGTGCTTYGCEPYLDDTPDNPVIPDL